jgi:hypothetical protein
MMQAIKPSLSYDGWPSPLDMLFAKENKKSLLMYQAKLNHVSANNALVDGRSIKRISQRHLQYTHYVLNSVCVPLAFAIVVTVSLASFDSFQRRCLSPLCFAPLMLLAFIGFNMFTDDNPKQPMKMRFLATLPLLYIVLTEFILGYRTKLHTMAILHIQPPFLAVLLARNVWEASCYLSLHLLLVIHMKMPDYQLEVLSLMMNDLLLLAAAWLKGELAWIAETLRNHYDVLCGYLSELTDGEDANREMENGSRMVEHAPRRAELPRAPLAAQEAGPSVDASEPSALSIGDLEMFDTAWNLQLQEPPFSLIEEACKRGNVESDVSAWLVRRWARAEIQLAQQTQQIGQLLGVTGMTGGSEDKL